MFWYTHNLITCHHVCDAWSCWPRDHSTTQATHTQKGITSFGSSTAHDRFDCNLYGIREHSSERRGATRKPRQAASRQPAAEVYCLLRALEENRKGHKSANILCDTWKVSGPGNGLNGLIAFSQHTRDTGYKHTNMHLKCVWISWIVICWARDMALEMQ